MKYKVRFMMNDIYEVVEIDDENDSEERSVYQGRLSDCEAYIRLKEAGFY